jgi:K+-transporting ATPase ATPase B chain
MPTSSAKARPLLEPPIVRAAIVDSLRKLHPRIQGRNPVMFVVLIGSILTTALWVQALLGRGEAPAWFIFWVAAWLWFTVVFANFAEAMAEGRGKAQADSLKKARRDIGARKLVEPPGRAFDPAAARTSSTTSAFLRKGDLVLVTAGEFIPGDGEITAGIASVDESAITGESAPVIREAGGDRSAVTGGTRVLSDWVVVRITSDPGETFLDRMIAMVEGAQRRKTPNEVALTILLAALTLIFLMVCVALKPFGLYSGAVFSGPVLTARVPHSNHDWRVAERHRYRRHGSPAAAQRARDERPRRRSLGRR